MSEQCTEQEIQEHIERRNALAERVLEATTAIFADSDADQPLMIQAIVRALCVFTTSKVTGSARDDIVDHMYLDLIQNVRACYLASHATQELANRLRQVFGGEGEIRVVDIQTNGNGNHNSDD